MTTMMIIELGEFTLSLAVVRTMHSHVNIQTASSILSMCVSTDVQKVSFFSSCSMFYIYTSSPFPTLSVQLF